MPIGLHSTPTASLEANTSPRVACDCLGKLCTRWFRTGFNRSTRSRLTMNGINRLSFVLSLLKDLIRESPRRNP